MSTYKRSLPIAIAAFVLFAGTAGAQINALNDVNTSKMDNYQNECAIAKDPTNHQRLFAACNNSTGGLFAARSTDLGATWTYPDPSKTIANGTPGLGPAACCDPTLAWDNFGNLFITYLGDSNTVETLLSTDGGLTFTSLATFGPAFVDQPTVAVGANSVWIVWNQSGQMLARGAPVTGLGVVGAFTPAFTVPGTSGCNFGDVAIAPSGAVVQACENPAGGPGPANILINIKPDGLGPNPFGAPIIATATNVGGFHFIPAQNTRSIDAEAGLAYDIQPASPHFGRLYLVYTDTPATPDTNILVRFSDNDGATWSAPFTVNDDASGRSQFLPRIASNALSGNIAVCWHDARNSGTNTTMEEFCSLATRLTPAPVFFANGVISDGASDGQGSNPPAAGLLDIQFGDYSGLAYFQGRFHPIWADVSNSTGDNPNGTSRFDAYTATANGLPAADEGDPHLTTVNGVHYDFQSAGEFVTLRDGGGMEIQTRQTPVATASAVGPNPHTGLTTCVSLNTAVAARVNGHRVSFQPNISGVPDPSGMQLRIDGRLTTLGSGAIPLGPGGSVGRSAASGIQVDFPDGTTLSATPLYWSSQGKWYLNLGVYHTSALEGLMGAIAPGNWLPFLPNGASLGPRPAALHQRYLDLYGTFANAWRVTDKTSLFDYAPGTSTATFTMPAWPRESPPCTLPATKPVKPIAAKVAREVCKSVIGKARNADCIFDVTVTGQRNFAKMYQLSEQIEAGGTTTTLGADRQPSRAEEGVMFTAAVSTLAAKKVPAGSVQFFVDGAKAGAPVALDGRGVAVYGTRTLKPGEHAISATYLPAKGSVFLGSSAAIVHVVASAAPSTVTINDLPMQSGNEKTACPALGVTYTRAQAEEIAYLRPALPALDQQCAARVAGLRVVAITVVKCAPDPRGAGFGPNATVNLSCGK